MWIFENNRNRNGGYDFIGADSNDTYLKIKAERHPIQVKLMNVNYENERTNVRKEDIPGLKKCVFEGKYYVPKDVRGIFKRHSKRKNIRHITGYKQYGCKM